MARIVIVYQSQHGFTQQFALWLAKGLHGEMVDRAFVTTEDFSGCELVVYGGHVLNHRVAGFRSFYRQFHPVLPEHIMLFGTGVATLSNREAQRVRAMSIRHCDPVALQFFYLRGRKDLTPLPLRIKLRLKLQGTQDKACDTGLAAVQPLIEAAGRLGLH